MTRLVHWQEDTFDVRIMRPSKWGNPFAVGKNGKRAECIEKYARWILDQPDLLAALPELKGKTIACCCVGVHDRCHGEILVKLCEDGIQWLLDWKNLNCGYDDLIKRLDK